MEIDQYLAFGCDVLSQAGRIAAAGFRQPNPITDKAIGHGFDPVTAVDRRVETAIRERIAERFPNHGIQGEELGEARGASAWSWVVDPIDGTRAYIAGLPTWGCLLGLLRDGEPVAGWMHQPVVGETFFGDGKRAWLANERGRAAIRTRSNATLADSILAATHPGMFDALGRPRFDSVAAQVRLTRFGGDCYNHCLLAHGFVDLVIEDDLKAHDILPLVPIVRGAGAVISNLAGATPRGGMVVAAANAPLHEYALGVMRG